jgi:uncharacterized protein YjbI with pentapeptide repeats
MADPANIRPDPKSLLDTANSASEKVAALHLGFMAVCAYLLVIVFGTTHLDLLLGKGIKLPFVDVEVPIAGFYTAAPYLLVLVHFNFLLQLQLLSRKLNAFNFIAPKDEWNGSSRDQLHGFPFTIYLIGRADPIVRALLELMVSITIILLPLITLLAIQLMFLAYGEESITWAQRAAICIDVVLIVALWPLIMDLKDDWRAFWSRIFAAYSPKWRLWLALPVLFAGLSLIFFSTSATISLMGFGLAIFSPLPTAISFKRGRRLGILPALVPLVVFLSFLSLYLISDHFQPPRSLVPAAVILVVPLAFFWKIFIQRGSLVLVMAICIFPLLSLSIMIDCEWMEQQVTRIQGDQQTQLCYWLEGFRHLSLTGQTLIAKHSARPEVLTLIRKGNWQEALTQIEPLKLGVNRKLRHAILRYTILTGAQLEGVDIQGADLTGALLQKANLDSARLQDAILNSAQLQGANLCSANLQAVILRSAKLQGSDLIGAKLQGADLNSAQLQGSDLSAAQLQGVDFHSAQLQGANLKDAKLQGADLGSAQLQGANLKDAQLQGANLETAQLQGAVLRRANLYGVKGKPEGDLVDAREIQMKPMSEKEVEKLVSDMPRRLNSIALDIRKLGSLTKSTIHLDSCLSDAKKSIPGLECGQRFYASGEKEIGAFIKELHPMLTDLACKSTEIAEGLTKYVIYPDKQEDSPARQGLTTQFVKRISDASCPGLWGLSPEKKQLLQDAAKQGK